MSATAATLLWLAGVVLFVAFMVHDRKPRGGAGAPPTA